MIQQLIYWSLVTSVMLFILHKIDFKGKVDEEDTSTWD